MAHIHSNNWIFIQKTINAIVKLHKIKYIAFNITKLKNTKERGHSVYGQWITAQFLNKYDENMNNERPTVRLCDQICNRSTLLDPYKRRIPVYNSITKKE
jgi:hypothetical protein